MMRDKLLIALIPLLALANVLFVLWAANFFSPHQRCPPTIAIANMQVAGCIQRPAAGAAFQAWRTPTPAWDRSGG